MSRTLAKFLSRLALLLFVHATLAFAQSDNGQISGQVTDPQGLAVPDAAVQVINQATLTKRETKTDAAGNYSVLSLPEGRYQVVVTVSGFSTVMSQDISVAGGQSAVFNVQLTVSKESE